MADASVRPLTREEFGQACVDALGLYSDEEFRLAWRRGRLPWQTDAIYRAGHECSRCREIVHGNRIRCRKGEGCRKKKTIN